MNAKNNSKAFRFKTWLFNFKQPFETSKSNKILKSLFIHLLGRRVTRSPSIELAPYGTLILDTIYMRTLAAQYPP